MKKSVQAAIFFLMLIIIASFQFFQLWRTNYDMVQYDPYGLYIISNAYLNNDPFDLFNWNQCLNSLTNIEQYNGSWSNKRNNHGNMTKYASKREWIFDAIYKNNGWGAGSGPGSNIRIRCILEEVLLTLSIDKIFDAACGDFRWMYVLLKDIKTKYNMTITYWGNDIAINVINSHLQTYKNETNLKFTNFDLTDCTKWPSDLDVQLIFIRKALQHNTITDVQQILFCADKSKIKWLMVTSYDKATKNKPISPGEMSKYHLLIQPYNLPAPFAIFSEGEVFTHLYRLPMHVNQYFNNSLL